MKYISYQMIQNVTQLMPILTTDFLMPADYRGQQGYATSYGTKMINNKMYLKGRITQ